MDKENGHTEYNDIKNEIPWLRMIITAIVLVAVVFIILLLVKGCGRSTLRRDLIKTAQNYYEKYSIELPKEVGECSFITLGILQDKGYINSSKYSTCSKTNTYVNVCHLENSKYNYSATLACENEKTHYGSWKDGKVENLKNTDVRFMFVGEQKKLVPDDTVPLAKYYYPTDSTDGNTINSYYLTAPNEEYSLKENEVTGYKWYTNKQVQSYWNNGQYSATAPNGYPNKTSQSSVTKYSDTKPEAATYRTIKETTVYRYKTVAIPYRYICVKPGIESDSITSENHCALDKSGYTQTNKVYYTCDNGNTTTGYGTVCKDYTEYTNKACTTNYSNGIICEAKDGYEYTDVVYKWYKNVPSKEYYPSKASSQEGENTYFISEPISGAIKDESTSAQVSKFYKTDVATDINMVEKWVDITNGYVDINSLISTFKELGYEVNNLSDIKSIDDIRYQLKMQYRNIEE